MTRPAGSFMLAADYRVADFDRWWDAMRRDRDDLATLGVHLLVVYRSAGDPRHVFVMAGLRTRERLDRVLSSPLLMEWFDRAGLENVPPVFVGTRVEAVRFGEGGRSDLPPGLVPTGVVIARVVRLADYDRYLDVVHAQQRRLPAMGMRQFWIYRAVDDGDEVMSIQEVDSLEHAHAWLRRPESDAQIDSEPGVGVYPPIFVGTVAGVVEIDEIGPPVS
jgi:hypothetical protein